MSFHLTVAEYEEAMALPRVDRGPLLWALLCVPIFCVIGGYGFLAWVAGFLMAAVMASST